MESAQIFHFFWEFSSRTNRRNVFHLPPNQKFRKFWLNGKRPMSLWPRTIKILISNWPRTRKFSQFFKNTGGKTISYHGHALVTLCVQFLCSDWSKFDRWVHAENLCSIFKVFYFDSWSWESFLSTCDVFNYLFPLDVQNEMQLLSRVFCYSWLVCLLDFWLINASLVKIQ